MRWFQLICLFTFLLVPITYSRAQTPEPEHKVQVHYYNAKATKLTPQPNVDNPDIPSDTIQITLEIQGGARNKQTVTALWSNDQQASRNFQVNEGSKVLVICNTIDGKESCDIVGQQRLTQLIGLLLLFAIIVWIITKSHGVRAMLTTIISLGVILGVLIPLLLRGWPPMPLTIVSALLIMVPTIYFSHGFNIKSHITLLSIGLIAILIAIMSYAFSNALSLMGVGSEEAIYIDPIINLRAILLSAILIGALGVIDDLAMTQVSIVNELHHSNPKMSSLALFRRAMSVGRDHISSVVNTLFLAYAGVSLPLLILIEQNHIPAFVALQQEPIATEIMRTVIGTIGLILVVPLATYLAAQAIHRFPNRFPTEEHHHTH